jgi:hypothetical protein
MSDGKVKGSIMVEVVKFLRTHKQRARAALPPELQHYLDSRILSTSWYPEEDYLGLMRAVIQLRPSKGTPGVSRWEEAARETATAHFEGPYKAMLRKGDPGRTLSSMQALWRLRHDTGEFQVDLPQPGRARLELRDYALVARESCEMVQGTLWGMLHHSGARGIEIAHTQCRSRGNPVCEWQLSWS